MAFGTVSDPLLTAALWTGCGALAATAGLLLAVVIMRLRLLGRLGHEQRVAALWNPLLAECAERVPAVLPPLLARDTESFMVLWCRAQESLRGEAQDHLREVARRLGIEADAQRMLASGVLREELLALVTLGNLRSRVLAPQIQILIPHRPSLVSLTAAQALVRIDPDLGVPRLLAATARRDDWPLARVVSMLRECDPQIVGAMLSAALRTELHRDRSGAGLARLLHLHATAHGETLRAAVLEVLQTATSADALTAALGALWHPEDVSHARRLLAHAEWPVRVAAAKALGRFGGREDFERLCVTLADRIWWVRYRAAQALCNLPQVDGAELVAVANRIADRFAADILRQALAERSAA